MPRPIDCIPLSCVAIGPSETRYEFTNMKNFLSAGILLASLCVALLAAAPSDEVFADLSVPAKRLSAQQAIFDYSRSFAQASDESKAWFKRVDIAQKSVEDPEAKASLAQTLALDPAVKTFLPMGKKTPVNYPAPEGTTPATKLAEIERLLDLENPTAARAVMGVDELAALVKGEEFAIAQRANRLLRRESPKLAAPLLWERLAKSTQRSQVLEIEEEILRLPISLAAQTTPLTPEGTALASKAAWVRIVTVRAAGGSRIRQSVKAAVLPLLKGSANELTEAAWDSVPRLFAEVDRAELTEAAKGLSERLAPRAKAALESLSAQ